MKSSSHHQCTQGIAVLFPLILSHPEKESDGNADEAGVLVRKARPVVLCVIIKCTKKRHFFEITISFKNVKFALFTSFSTPKEIRLT